MERHVNQQSTLLGRLSAGESIAAAAQQVLLMHGYTNDPARGGKSWQLGASEGVYWESMSSAMLQGALDHGDRVTADKAITGLALLMQNGEWEYVYLNALFYQVDFIVLS